jgi:hypothetical protein
MTDTREATTGPLGADELQRMLVAKQEPTRPTRRFRFRRVQ